MGAVHIIGAGVAGLSAALQVSEQGGAVHLYEAAGNAGGRCRSYEDAQLGCEIDNGNHLLLGSNRKALALLAHIGAQRHWLKQSQGYAMYDVRCRQHCMLTPVWWRMIPRIYREAVCHSVLNTPLATASWRMMIRVASKMMRGNGWMAYLPQVPLQQAFIHPLLEAIHANQASIDYHHALKEVVCDADGRVSRLRFGHRDIVLERQDAVIVAVPAWEAQRLMPPLCVPTQHEPIINVHFRFSHSCDLRVVGILQGTAEWIFTKSDIISTTTSVGSRYADTDQELLVQQLWHEVCLALNISAPLPPYRLIVEKRATFSCTRRNLRQRPAAITAYPNLFLAGDYTATHLPACIEGAVQSGQKAATLALKWIAKPTT